MSTLAAPTDRRAAPLATNSRVASTRAAASPASPGLLQPDKGGHVPAAMAGASYAAEITRPPPDAARQRAVQERPTAYAESPRPLRHEGPSDRSAACPPGDRNVANPIVSSAR